MTNLTILCFLALTLQCGQLYSDPSFYRNDSPARIFPEAGVSLEPLNPVYEKLYTWVQVIQIPTLCITGESVSRIKDRIMEGSTALDSLLRSVDSIINQQISADNSSQDLLLLMSHSKGLAEIVTQVKERGYHMLDVMTAQRDEHDNLWGLIDSHLCASSGLVSNKLRSLEDLPSQLQMDEALMDNKKRDETSDNRRKRNVQLNPSTLRALQNFHFYSGANYFHNPYLSSGPSPMPDNGRHLDIQQPKMRALDAHPNNQNLNSDREPFHTSESPSVQMVTEKSRKSMLLKQSELDNLFADDSRVYLNQSTTNPQITLRVGTAFICEMTADPEFKCHKLDSDDNQMYFLHKYLRSYKAERRYHSHRHRRHVLAMRGKLPKIGKKYLCATPFYGPLCISYIAPQVIDNLTRQTTADIKRHKRGLLNFIGDIHSFLFGTATEAQIEKVKESVELLSDATISNRQSITDLRESLINISSYLDNRISQAMNSTSSAIKEIDTNIHILEDAVAHIGTQTSTLTKNQKAIMIMSLLTTKSLQLNLAIDKCLSYLHSIRERFLAYRYMFLTQSLSPDVITPGVAARILQHIKSIIPFGTETAEGFSTLAWYNKDYSLVGYKQGRLMILLKVPLVYEHEKMVALKIQSIPIKSKVMWIQYAFDDHVILQNSKTHSWAVVSLNDYLNCYMNQFHTCPHNVAWRPKGSNQCIPSLLEENMVFPRSCNLTMLSDPPSILPSIKPVWPDAWLVSFETDNNEYTSLCYHDATSTRIPKIGTLPSQSVVRVDPKCIVRINDIELRSPYSRDIVDTSFNESELTNISDYNIDFENLIQVEPIFLNLSEVDSGDFILKSKTSRVSINIPSNSGKLINLVNSLRDRDKTREDFVEKKVNDSIGKLKNLTYIPGWDISLPSLNWSLLSASSVSLVMSLISLIISCYLWCHRVRGAALSAIPMQRMVGYSLPISSTVVNVTGLNSTTIIQGANTTQKTWFQSYHDSMGTSWGSILTMSLICGFIMYLCSLHTIKSMSRLVHKQLAHVGKYANNKSGKQHLGEVQVIGYFILGFKTLFSKKTYAVEVGIQIATIPMTVDDWVLKRPVDFGRWILQNSTWRWSNTLTFKLKWGPVCILNKRYPNLESCQDMPNKVTLDMEETLSSIYNSIPSFWTRLSVVNVSRLFLYQNGRVVDLYNYTDG